MTEYIAHANCTVDTLATTGVKLTDGEIILIVLGGLGPEYEAFVTSITTWFDPSMTFVDFRPYCWTRTFIFASILMWADR